ncbi:ABC transporter ATP-binding protein [candidate division WOR-3 bacterium]|nr:ABC transporter ATP-binding protein [candidate division WOR-3 bacterium]
MIEISGLKVDLGNFALRDIDLQIERGEYFIVLGPTGAGKSVLLEAIAGLYPVLEGKIIIDGRDITELSPEKRNIGIVYQDYSLFPHMSAAENIAFGLKVRKTPGKKIKEKIDYIAAMTHIEDLLERKPDTLSGGEKQKIALARALVTDPDILLLDEPLSALDPSTREKMRYLLEELHRELKVTVIHVTHDFEEAAVLGDRVTVIKSGVIVQTGSPDYIMRHPKTEFVADFALTRNVFKGKVKKKDGDYAEIDVSGATIRVLTDKKEDVMLSLRPEEIILSRNKFISTARNCLKGIVLEISNRGSYSYITVSAGQDFVCMVTNTALDELELKKNDEAWIVFKASAVHVF